MTDNATPQGSIEIDAGLCSGLGECTRGADGIVEIGPDGIARVVTASGDLALLQRIADSCPMAAITVHARARGQVA
jgi:ferredoxin